MNVKKMSQEEFDKYMIFELIPDLNEEYGEVNYIVITRKGKFKFAKECKECHDIILLDKEYEMASEITKVIGNNPTSYLEILTELEVVTLNDINECECFDDELVDDDYIVEEDEEDLYESDMLKEDAYDDIDEY